MEGTERRKATSIVRIVSTALLGISLLAALGCAPSAAATPSAVPTAPAAPVESTAPAATVVPTVPVEPATPAEPGASEKPSSAQVIHVVVAGYIRHGPMQETVRAAQGVFAGYGDSLEVTWLDLAASDGRAYCNQNGLTAHFNIVINSRYEYPVNGKTVTFQWFEGQQWTAADLDAVLAGLVDGQ
jgi:hypothetical protein